jgi:hypothetical protein
VTTENDADKLAGDSYLFTVRLWSEDLGSGQIERRGRVQHVASGESRYFRDWQTFEAFIEGLIPAIRGSDQAGVDIRHGQAPGGQDSIDKPT